MHPILSSKTRNLSDEIILHSFHFSCFILACPPCLSTTITFVFPIFTSNATDHKIPSPYSTNHQAPAHSPQTRPYHQQIAKLTKLFHLSQYQHHSLSLYPQFH